MKVNEAITNSEHVIVLGGELMKTNIAKQLDLRFKGSERCRRYVEAMKSIRARRATSSDGPPTDIFDSYD